MQHTKDLNTPRLFRFKQFSLTDHNCAMKIGTDGVLLGSIAAKYPFENALDIGTGCGLIAIMVAQQSIGKIDAIEYDKDTATVAEQNVLQSPWPDKILVLHNRFQDFWPNNPKLYELIVCNPPFFHNSLKSNCGKRTMARHSDSLTADEILIGAKNLLSTNGSLLTIVPFLQEQYWQSTAKNFGLFCNRRIEILPRPELKPKRIVLEFTFSENQTLSETICIETSGRHAYSEDYRKITGDYYLNF
ncbi:MAG TPA: tRNA (adenosine(37)-N6)-methyltransferase TrmM [Bacteroidales bacterium]|nr:tRNA (adenosine(37)-N6)-methyltransferase TrmM [Bacteroidales bacterium]